MGEDKKGFPTDDDLIHTQAGRNLSRSLYEVARSLYEGLKMEVEQQRRLHVDAAELIHDRTAERDVAYEERDKLKALVEGNEVRIKAIVDEKLERDRDAALKALRRCCEAMAAWGAEEDGIPSGGHGKLGGAFAAYNDGMTLLGEHPESEEPEPSCCVCGRVYSACARHIIDPAAYPEDGEWFCSPVCNQAYHAAEGDYGKAREILCKEQSRAKPMPKVTDEGRRREGKEFWEAETVFIQTVEMDHVRFDRNPECYERYARMQAQFAREDGFPELAVRMLERCEEK